MEKRILNVASGKDTYGTDFVDLYPSRPEVKKWDGESNRLPFKNNTFDEVYSRCFLEHCMNPGSVIKEMVRVTKKGGKIRIITDNANYWVFSHKNSLHKGAYEGGGFGGEDRHYILFTDWHLRNYFRKFGVKVIQVKYRNEDQNISNAFLKSTVKKIINFILGHTPLKTMAYMRIEIAGRK